MNQIPLAIYIDDEHDGINNAKDLAKRLERQGTLRVSVQNPPELDKVDQWKSEDPQIFLVDYDLSTRSVDSAQPTYRGTTLSTEIRERFVDYPIVIVTQGITDDVQKRLKTANPIFDEVVLKSEINEISKVMGVIGDFVDLAKGYEVLRNTSERSRKSLERILEVVNEDDLSEIHESGIPLVNGDWQVESMARWIRHVFLEYPGVVMDERRAAAYLGLDLVTFRIDEIRTMFERAEYRGLFHASKPRWWRSGLVSIATEITMQNGVDEVFYCGLAKALKAQLKSTVPDVNDQIKPSRCIWDGSPYSNMLCYILNEPVQVSNSFRYFPDGRPAIMEAARISFRAIWDRNFDVDFLEAGADQYLDRIQSGKDPLEDANDAAR